MAKLSIGRLAAAADVKVPTIRFYEQAGLMPAPERTASDRRIYDERALERLAFIKRARYFGFSLDAIRELISLADAPERLCPAGNAMAKEQLSAIDAKIRELEALRAELERILTHHCHGNAVHCCIADTFEHLAHCGPDGAMRTPR